MITLSNALRKLHTLDRKIEQLDFTYNSMLQSAPYGQHSPVMQRTLDKMVKLSERKATIWNAIRNLLVCENSKRTLWQKALESNLPIRTWGQEEMLLVKTTDIEALITMPIKAERS